MSKVTRTCPKCGAKTLFHRYSYTNASKTLVRDLEIKGIYTVKDHIHSPPNKHPDLHIVRDGFCYDEIWTDESVLADKRAFRELGIGTDIQSECYFCPTCNTYWENIDLLMANAKGVTYVPVEVITDDASDTKLQYQAVHALVYPGVDSAASLITRCLVNGDKQLLSNMLHTTIVKFISAIERSKPEDKFTSVVTHVYGAEAVQAICTSEGGRYVIDIVIEPAKDNTPRFMVTICLNRDGRRLRDIAMIVSDRAIVHTYNIVKDL